MTTLLLIALSLSSDAIAVSASNSLYFKNHKNLYFMPIYFGIFQSLMTILGYSLGHLVSGQIQSFGNTVVCFLLCLIGIKMIFEAIKNDNEHSKELTHKAIATFAIATSIDAFAVGISFAILGTEIISSSIIIGIVTFLCCALVVKIANKITIKNTKTIEIIAGIVLILIGINSL